MTLFIFYSINCHFLYNLATQKDCGIEIKIQNFKFSPAKPHALNMTTFYLMDVFVTVYFDKSPLLL